ncbi:MAG: molybdopterin-dependent oxidoreductase, partial [Burkholderiaceae bacterium]|nr:molybdopterin-dependent oxidoreductase [Burkholderiaceae bacterium]
MGQPQAHESAWAHVQGAAPFVDDLPEVQGTLYAAPILSPLAHGRLLGVDSRAAQALPGVRGVVLAADVPGDPVLACLARDEPVFASDILQYAGQVIGLVVADSVAQARRAARAVQLDLQPLPAVLTIADAMAAQHWAVPPVVLRRGEPEAALARAPHRLSGTLQIGGQEHLYLEGQIAYALPQEQNQWCIYSSTQHPGEVQHGVASALGLAAHAVRVECRRMGGGFGGKETQAGPLAVWAAVAAHRLGRPVKLRLSRADDGRITGKRHPFECQYTVGFDGAGRIQGLQLQLASNCGFSADLSGPINDRAVFHCDNAYFLGDVEIASYRCKTHLQSHTAFRGFGGPQGMLLMETLVGDIARTLGQDALTVRQRNLYGPAPRNATPYGMQVFDNILPQML